VAGAAAAAGKGVSASTTTLPLRPDLGGDIALLSSSPPPGGTISVAGTVVSMTFKAVSPYAVPPGPARVIFSRSVSFLETCATLSGSHPGLQPNEPITLTLTDRVVNSASCGDRYDVRRVRVLLQQAGGPQVLQTGTGFLPDMSLQFAVVP
jgi:hypothetical protein